MDPRYFGNLIFQEDFQDRRRRFSQTAAEDAYYDEHRLGERRILRLSFAITVAWFGFIAVGVWLR